MRGRGVADLVHAVHDGVESGVVADGGIRAVEVVVYGARQADDGHVVLAGQPLRPGERTVAADHDERVNPELLHVLIGLVHALVRAELIAPGGFKDGSAPLDGVAHRFGGKFLDVPVDESFIAPVDAVDLPSLEDCRTGDGADRRVHSGRVAAGSEDAYRLDFCHFSMCLLFLTYGEGYDGACRNHEFEGAVPQFI